MRSTMTLLFFEIIESKKNNMQIVHIFVVAFSLARPLSLFLALSIPSHYWNVNTEKYSNACVEERTTQFGIGL